MSKAFEMSPELERMQAQLAAMILEQTREDGAYPTAIPGLSLFRSSELHPPTGVFYEPALILVCQGLKRLVVGEASYTYDRSRFVLTSMHLPAIYESLEASLERPSLCLILRFDPLDLSELILQLGPDQLSAPQGQGLGLFAVTDELLNGMRRLLELLKRPRDIAVLSPLINREILYRLLVSPCGALLRQLAREDSSFALVTRAVNWLREHYTETLRIEQLAEVAHMSTSSLHHQFKSLTGLSPGQYQKQLRLHEARRLMLAGGSDAASVGQYVGYGSPSHFSRDYRRCYGAPPLRDMRQLKQILQRPVEL